MTDVTATTAAPEQGEGGAKKQPEGFRARLAPYAPPLVPMLLALLGCLLVVHLLLPLLKVDLPWYLVSLMDIVVVAAVGVGSWFFRHEYLDSHFWKRWAPWEVPFGTLVVAVVICVMGVVAMLGLFRHLQWLGFALSVAVIGFAAVVVARKRPARRPDSVVAPGETPEPLEDYQRISMAWSLDPGLPDVHGEASIWIKKATVEEFREKNPGQKVAGDLPDFGWYIENGECQEVNELADKLIEASRNHGLTSYLEVALVLDMVQKLRYVRDIVSKGVEDYWRFALETLSDKEGDCEDFSILCVALLSAMGHKTCFFYLPKHAAIGVAGLTDEAGVWVEAADGERYYYAETTQDGWKLGELPDDFTRDQIRVAGVVPPLRARRKDPALRRVDPKAWRRESRGLLWAGLGVAVVGAGLGALAALAG